MQFTVSMAKSTCREELLGDMQITALFHLKSLPLTLGRCHLEFSYSFFSYHNLPFEVGFQEPFHISPQILFWGENTPEGT